MLMSLTTRLCPNWPDDSWGTTSVVAIPVPFLFEPYKVDQANPIRPGFLRSENPLVYRNYTCLKEADHPRHLDSSGYPVPGSSGAGSAAHHNCPSVTDEKVGVAAHSLLRQGLDLSLTGQELG